MTPPCPSYAGHRFPAEIISHAVCLSCRFHLSLRNVDEILPAVLWSATRRCGSGASSLARYSPTRSGAGWRQLGQVAPGRCVTSTPWKGGVELYER
jgi:hypothetical protein